MRNRALQANRIQTAFDESSSIDIRQYDGAWEHDSPSGKGTITTKPKNKVEIKAAFEKIVSVNTTFADIDESAWYFEAARHVYENGLMRGVTEDLKEIRDLSIWQGISTNSEPPFRTDSEYRETDFAFCIKKLQKEHEILRFQALFCVVYKGNHRLCLWNKKGCAYA